MDNQKNEDIKSEKPLWELLDSQPAYFYVGDDNTRWVLPEKLLTYSSPVLARSFAEKEQQAKENGSPGKRPTKSYSLPDQENDTFSLLVAFLYGQTLPPATSEDKIGPLLDLYLLADKFQIESLTSKVVDSVRDWYHQSATYPSLRRVQYIYTYTDEDNQMREMMVSSVARQLATSEKIPLHWAKALQRNGQLAVDIIRAIQQWHIEEKTIPDVRDVSITRGRHAKGGFSAVEREGESEMSHLADSAIGMQSDDEEAQDSKAGADDNMQAVKEVAGEAQTPSRRLISSSPASLSLLQAQLKRPPDPDQTAAQQHANQAKRRKGSVMFAPEPVIVRIDTPPEDAEEVEAEIEEDEEVEEILRKQVFLGKAGQYLLAIFRKREAIFLAMLWIFYLVSLFGVWPSLAHEN